MQSLGYSARFYLLFFPDGVAPNLDIISLDINTRASPIIHFMRPITRMKLSISAEPDDYTIWKIPFENRPLLKHLAVSLGGGRECYPMSALEQLCSVAQHLEYLSFDSLCNPAKVALDLTSM